MFSVLRSLCSQTRSVDIVLLIAITGLSANKFGIYIYMQQTNLAYIYILTVTLWRTTLSRGVGVGIWPNKTKSWHTYWQCKNTVTYSITRHTALGDGGWQTLFDFCLPCYCHRGCWRQVFTSVFCLSTTADFCPLFTPNSWPLSPVYLQQLTSVLCLFPTADLCLLFVSNIWHPSSVYLQQLTSTLCLSPAADFCLLFIPKSWLLFVYPQVDFHLLFIPNSWLQSVLCLSPTADFCLSPTADFCLSLTTEFCPLFIHNN